MCEFYYLPWCLLFSPAPVEIFECTQITYITFDFQSKACFKNSVLLYSSREVGKQRGVTFHSQIQIQILEQLKGLCVDNNGEIDREFYFPSTYNSIYHHITFVPN